MAVSEPDRQVEIAEQLCEQARVLCLSTREFPHRGDSYTLLGALRVAVADLGTVCAQLGSFHADARDGTDYTGEDPGGSGQSAQEAAVALKLAESALTAAEAALGQAHSASSHIRWNG